MSGAANRNVDLKVSCMLQCGPVALNGVCQLQTRPAQQCSHTPQEK